MAANAVAVVVATAVTATVGLVTAAVGVVLTNRAGNREYRRRREKKEGLRRQLIEDHRRRWQERDRRRREEEVPLKILERGPAAVEAYNKALLEGKTHVQRIPVMIVGQQDTGKTSVKKSLTGEIFNEMQESTEGIDADPNYFNVSTEIWKTGETKKGNESVSEIPFEHYSAARLISKSLKEETPNSLNTAESTVVTAASRSSEEPSSSSNEATFGVLNRGIGISLEPSTNGTNTTAEKVTSNEGPTLPGHYEEENDDLSPVSELPGVIAALVEEMLQSDGADEEEVIYSVLWDFAGQSVYYNTHPVFLTNKAIYILVSDLSRNKDERPSPPVRKGIYTNTEDIFCNKTNLDYLDFWMSSICSLNPGVIYQESILHVSETSSRLPPVFLVCTHADKPFDNKNPRDLALETYGILRTKNKTYREHLFKDVFSVDNTKSGSEQECPEVLRLRKELLAVAKELPQLKEEIPLKWLKYEKALQSIRQKGYKWTSVTHARDIAFKGCRISDDVEFSTLLNYLHDQRSLIHFTGSATLEAIVILDPQWLIDVFKKVITVKRYDETQLKNEELWRKLEKSGILDEELLEDAWKHLYANQETLESLVAIMERFSLLCPWPSSNERRQYLVPSMLLSPPTDDVLKLLAAVQVPSLFVKFTSGPVPLGLFSRFILQFFQWCDKEWKSPVKPRLHKNFAMFHIRPDEGSSVTFLCHSSSIEIIFLSGNDDLDRKADLTHGNFDVTTSRSIQWQLTLILECMRKEFFWLENMTYEMCVCCPVCSKSVKCRDHGMRGCEECLHFLSQSDLCRLKYCERAGICRDCRIHVEQFVPWFSLSDEPKGRISINQQEAAYGRDVDVTQTDGRRIVSMEGMDCQTLALPDGVMSSIQSEMCGPKGILSRFQESLQLDSVSIANPEPETKRWIRCFASQAKSENRTDVVEYLREITATDIIGQTLALPDGGLKSIQSQTCVLKDIKPGTKRWIRSLAIQAKSENRTDVVEYLRKITPAGTTGPLLNEDLDVRRIPFPQRKDLTFSLSSRDEWKLLAERLGLSQIDIDFLDKRVRNPCDVVLGIVGNHRHLSVGEIYDTLVGCELPAIADIM